MNDLTPQQLQAVLYASQHARTAEEYNAILQSVNLAGSGISGSPLEYRQSQNWQYGDPNNPENSGQYLGAPNQQITQQINGSGSHTWDPQSGKYTGLSSGMSEGAQTLMALTMLAGGAAGAYSAGAGAGAGAGAAGAGAGAGVGAGTGTAGGLVTLTPAEIAATNTAATAGLGSQVAATMPALGATGAAGAVGAGVGAGTAAGGTGGGVTAGQAASAGTTGLNAMRQGEIAGYETNGSVPSSAAVDGGGDWLSAASKLFGNNAGGLLGALGGYLDSKDKQETTNRDPWGPAQPYLKGLLQEGAGLYDQYKQQPFSPSEQNAYGNVGNVLDYMNANAGGLLSGFQANASGANQFSRNNPRRSLIGSSYDPGTSPVAWQPGLLGNFGTRKG
jgi:hypothetical protein